MLVRREPKSQLGMALLLQLVQTNFLLLLKNFMAWGIGHLFCHCLLGLVSNIIVSSRASVNMHCETLIIIKSCILPTMIFHNEGYCYFQYTFHTNTTASCVKVLWAHDASLLEDWSSEALDQYGAVQQLAILLHAIKNAVIKVVISISFSLCTGLSFYSFPTLNPLFRPIKVEDSSPQLCK